MDGDRLKIHSNSKLQILETERSLTAQSNERFDAMIIDYSSVTKSQTTPQAPQASIFQAYTVNRSILLKAQRKSPFSFLETLL